MVRRWAILRRAVQNSAEVATSTQSVRIASETSSPPPTRLDPLFVALRQLSEEVPGASLVQYIEQSAGYHKDHHHDDIRLHDGRRHGRRKLGEGDCW